MQVLPLLTPTNFMTNNKKRSRSASDDFESHCLKKRLISTIPNLTPPTTPTSANSNVDDVIEEEDIINDDDIFELPLTMTEKNNSTNPRIEVFELNGTMLPLEQKPGEFRYTIPGFVLNSQHAFNDNKDNRGQLILYDKSRHSALLSMLMNANTSNDDDEEQTATIEELPIEEDQVEPMDID